VALFASVVDLRTVGINGAALAGIPDADLLRALETASSRASGYLGARYRMPLVRWGDDLREVVCALAAWRILSARRGFNPEAGSDVAIRQNFEDAVRWLTAVARNDIEPQDIVDSSPPDEDEGGAYVVTERRRGW
jgi:phage gp36-like protein